MRLGRIVLLVTLLSACDLPPPVVDPTQTPVPTPTWTPLPEPTSRPLTPTSTVPPMPSPTPQLPDTGWHLVLDGVEVRSLDAPASSGVDRITVVRVEPAALRFQVVYLPGEPHLVSAWAQRTGSSLVVNAGYFTPEHVATGLTISDGVSHGASYGDYAGMFAVPVDGLPQVRWLRTHPYDAREPLREAVQCFPVLVKPGGVMGFPADADDGRPARRTVVAQDRSGRVLFLVAWRGLFGLHALALWLVESDLDVEIALNLDGGPSSGLWLGDEVRIDSLVPVPAVITAVRADPDLR